MTVRKWARDCSDRLQKRPTTSRAPVATVSSVGRVAKVRLGDYRDGWVTSGWPSDRNGTSNISPRTKRVQNTAIFGDGSVLEGGYYGIGRACMIRSRQACRPITSRAVDTCDDGPCTLFREKRKPCANVWFFVFWQLLRVHKRPRSQSRLKPRRSWEYRT